MSNYFNYENKEVIDAIKYSSKDIQKRVRVTAKSEKTYRDYKYFRVLITSPNGNIGIPMFNLINIPSSLRVPVDEEQKKSGICRIKFNQSVKVYDKSCNAIICPGEWLSKLADIIVNKIKNNDKLSKKLELTYKTYIQKSVMLDSGDMKAFDEPIVWIFCRSSRGYEWEINQGYKEGDLRFSVFNLSKEADNKYYEYLARTFPNEDKDKYTYGPYCRILNDKGGLTADDLSEIYKPGTKLICSVVPNITMNYRKKTCTIKLELLYSKNMVIDPSTSTGYNACAVDILDLKLIAKKNKSSSSQNNNAQNNNAQNNNAQNNNAQNNNAQNNNELQNNNQSQNNNNDVEIIESDDFNEDDFEADIN